MSVVLLILKIIGLLLLAILGLLLLAVLLLLLVPVRYRICGKVDEDDGITAELRLNWLCHLVSYRFVYLNKERKKTLKIFGIPLRREGKGKEAKRDKNSRKQKDKKKAEEEKKEKDQQEISKSMEAPEDGFMENVPQGPEDGFTENVPQGPEDGRKIAQIPEGPPERISLSASPKGQKKSRRPSFFKKLKAFPGMIKVKLETLKEKVRSIKSMISRIHREWEDENNRRAVKLVWQELKGFLKHFLPKKARVDAAFSTGEPDTTGQALGVISMMPFIYRYKIRLVPDFESEKFYFRGTFDIRGHVYGIHVALLLYHLIKDKNIRGIIQRYRNS